MFLQVTEMDQSIDGRHNLIFPMFEFEMKGGYDELIKMEEELLTYLGIKILKVVNYGCVKIINHLIYHTNTNKNYTMNMTSIFLKKFPTFTSPFGNAKI